VRGNHSEDADEGLLAADFRAHIFTKHCGLEIGRDQPRGHFSVTKPSTQDQDGHHNSKRDAVVAENLHAVIF
jgi:hypothetical protein